MAGIFVSVSAAVVFLFLFVKDDKEDNDHATLTEALMIVEKCTVVWRAVNCTIIEAFASMFS